MSECGEGISRHSFQFQKLPTTRLSAAGIPYVKYVEVGVPSIPREMLNCVFYLYRSRAEAAAGKNFGGAGFFAGIRSKTNENVTYLYACTNWHVAVRDGFSVLRVNTKDGGIDFIELDSSDWHYVSQGGDMAVAGLALDLAKLQVSFIGLDTKGISLGLGVTREENESAFIGVGEDVMMIGRFIDHDGGQRNVPAVRFGNISICPTRIEWANSGPSIEYYCLDMHSRTGFSGSPVFAYRTPGSNLIEAFAGNLTLSTTIVKFLGIHCGQFPDQMKVEIGGHKGVVTGVSGMTVVLPAWELVDLLNGPPFSTGREQTDQQWSGRVPCAE